MRNLILVSCCAVVFWTVPAAAAPTYTLDKAHSSIGFSIAHMMVSKTTGGFDDITGTVQFDPADLDGSMIEVTVKSASINTKNEQRDAHLRAADFFDAEKYPLILFKSKKIVSKSLGSDEYLVTGDLTMKDVTRQIEVPVKVAGPVKSPMSGGQVIGLEARFTVNRQDYGVNWNKMLDNGGLVIGNEVDVFVAIEASGM